MGGLQQEGLLRRDKESITSGFHCCAWSELKQPPLLSDKDMKRRLQPEFHKCAYQEVFNWVERGAHEYLDLASHILDGVEKHVF